VRCAINLVLDCFSRVNAGTLTNGLLADPGGTRIAPNNSEFLLVYGVLMLRLSKVQFSRAIEGSDVTTDKNAPLYGQNQSKRTSRFLVTALVVALGIGAGWMGGKVLNGRMSHSIDAATPIDVSAGDNPAPISQPQPESRPVKHAATPEKPATASQPAPEDEQPVVASESRPKEAEPKGAPPEVPRVEKEEEADKPAEDPSKEIGRKALKQMKEVTNKNSKPPGNKNEREDKQ